MRKFFNKMKIVDEQIVETLHIHRSVHLAKLMVQFSPPVGAGLMMCHTASLLCGCVWTIASVIARSALLVFALMVVLSVAFGFCWIHRAFCAYNLLVNPVSNTRSCSGSERSLPRRDGSCLRLAPCFSPFTSEENGL